MESNREPSRGAPWLPIGMLAMGTAGCDYAGNTGSGAAEVGSGFFQYVLFLCAILAAVIIVGGVLAMFVRRWFRSTEPSSGIGFTLEDLRLMHDRGELTLEEFENARARMVRNVRGTDSSRPDRSESRVSGRIPPPR